MSRVITSIIPLGIAASLGVACADGAVPAYEGPGVAIAIAPLELPSVTDADWRLSVENGSGELVWTKEIGADAFGDGAGSVSFVGPCDADDNDNRVLVELLRLYGPGGAVLPASGYVNPGVLTRTVTCDPNGDVAVQFDVTIARDASQGFFDIAVELDDVFCSAKLDCERDGQPIELLSDEGARKPTVVVGFACTGGLGSVESWLYFDAINVTCDDNWANVQPAAGPGVLWNGAGVDQNVSDALLFSAGVYRGVEHLGFNKLYWNVALGPIDGAGANCHLSARATAADGPLVNSTTPAGHNTPFITWDVNITDASGAISCTQHPLNGGNGVGVDYTPLESSRRFGASWYGFEGQAQTMLVPSYFYPTNWLPEGSPWDDLPSGRPTLTTVILNPNDGPDSAVDPEHTVVVDAMEVAGVDVIGYVLTGYATRDPAEVRADIDAYYAFYPTVDGIFFDETTSDVGAGQANLSYYQDLVSYVKTTYGADQLTVLNPGVLTDEAYQGVADIICVFEGSAATYIANTSLPGWTADYDAAGFYHIVHDASAEQVRTLVELGKTRNAGVMYITDDSLVPDDNPYDTLPSYLYPELDYLAAGRR